LDLIKNQNQYTKISCLSINQKWTVWERNQENKSIHNNIKKLKYLWKNVMKEVKDLWNEN
jgi:hypothetical protein